MKVTVNKPALHSVMALALSASTLVACNDNLSAPEKGHEVKATGYVDLAPPSNYSPERGIVCYSGSVDAANQLTGACFNTTDSSPFLTQKYISLSAARKVNESREANNTSVQTVFEVGTGFQCNSAEKTCYYTGNGENKPVIAARHTKALYGFPRLQPERTGELQDIPPLNMYDYRWMDIKQLALADAAGPEQIAQALKTTFAAKEPSEGNYSEVMAQYTDPASGGGITVFTLANIPDDSVRSIQYVAETNKVGDTIKITGFGQRFQCWRGANAEQWTREQCL